MNDKNFHFIGIGGIGMSALARILLKKNARISGSDQTSNKVIQQLIGAGASVNFGHDQKNVAAGATVIYSSAIHQDNPEMIAAKLFNCPLLHRSELLALLTKGSKTLAVTGSHGKTTTSSFLITVLKKANFDPSYALGGILLDSDTNGEGGDGEYFILEADESDGSFLNYNVTGAIVTNIDNDHMDHYGTLDGLKEAMRSFINRVCDSRLLFWCGDDPHLREISPPGISYGFSTGCAHRIIHYQQRGWLNVFDADIEGQLYREIEVPLIGRHHVLNAVAVFGFCLQLGIPEETVRAALKSFSGVARRCEKKGESKDILILDDYGHHPTEIFTTLKAIKQACGDRRLIAVFQPHRYSRTQSCLENYANAFDPADHLFITDIYPGPGEIPIPNLSSLDVLSTIRSKSSIPFNYVPRNELKLEIKKFLRPDDVLVTLSAGDLPKLAEELASEFR